MSRVLLIADEEADRARVRGLLQGTSEDRFALDLAGTYRQAVAMAAQAAYGAILLDRIAGYDGPLDLLRQAVAGGGLSGPFLVLLPTADRALEHATIEAGAARCPAQGYADRTAARSGNPLCFASRAAE